jgi:hypothetical protein
MIEERKDMIRMGEEETEERNMEGEKGERIGGKGGKVVEERCANRAGDPYRPP